MSRDGSFDMIKSRIWFTLLVTNKQRGREIFKYLPALLFSNPWFPHIIYGLYRKGKEKNVGDRAWDCHVATLLAMTEGVGLQWWIRLPRLPLTKVKRQARKDKYKCKRCGDNWMWLPHLPLAGSQWQIEKQIMWD